MALSKRIQITSFVFSALIGAAACSPNQQTSAEKKENEWASLAAIDSAHSRVLTPRPSDPQAELSQLKRYRGQTAFLNPLYYRYGEGDEKQDAPKQGAGEREQQESDIYKIGKPGSKLLYLLNNYRGLQVVSYQAGPENPQLLGRAISTGGTPYEMYYDAGQERLIAVQHDYSYRGEDDYQRSELAIYDVRDPAKPRLAETIQVGGSISDSRIVGDVLYIAARKGKEGFVRSYSLKSANLRVVQEVKLSLPVSSSENMNILTVDKDGKQAYYLVATLSEKSWGWWDESSVVEVVDISDEKGKIQPLMSVAARGVVRERTQTMIKNDTLIVTSNYNLGREDGLPARIAVETFRFPTQNSEVITDNEAQYRKLHIERALKGKTGKEYQDLLEKLMTDPETGLRGRFVNAGQGLRKIVNDSMVTVGDGSGLDANLRDVRYQGGHLYAFWVPANEVDPFDLFDISEPEKGVRYINRLHFDGWIDRAIPMTHAGREFVLGLGWVVPVENNEQNRRRPQAMIFEITQDRGKLRAIDVAQFSFENSDIWTNFNDQDKMIEVNFSGDGKGEILFGASRYSEGESSSGGQILAFDLGMVVGGSFEKALTAGPFLSGGADWIRRAFTNTEINRINTFSDRQLATYGERAGGAGETLHPVHVLELARSLSGYASLAEGLGVQIISEGYWYARESKTELRLVRQEAVDSEKHQALQSVMLDGAYLDHMKEAKSGDLLVLTSQYQNLLHRANRYNYRTVLRLARYQVSGGKLVEKARIEMPIERQEERMPSARAVKQGHSLSMPKGLVQLADGTVLAQAESFVYRVDVSSGLNHQRLELQGCELNDETSVGVRVLAGQPYLTWTEQVESQQYSRLVFGRNFLSRVALEQNQMKCQGRVNIPGTILLATSTGELMTQDEWVKDIVRLPRETTNEEQEERYELKTQNSLVSLKLENAAAVLKDEVESQRFDRSSAFPIGENLIVQVRQPDYESAELEFLGVNEKGEIERDTYGFVSELAKGAALAAVVPVPGATGQFYGWVSGSDSYWSASQAQVIKFSLTERRPQLMSLVKINEHFEPLSAQTKVELPRAWGEQIHFTPEKQSFEIVQGLYGITQVLVK